MFITFITSVITGEARDSVGRVKQTLVIYMLAALLVLVGILFLILAAYIFVASVYGPLPAAIGFGAGFIIIALLAVFIHNMSTKKAKRRASERRRSEFTALAGASALALLPGLLARGGGLRALVVPALAAAAYAIYRENSKPGPRREP